MLAQAGEFGDRQQQGQEQHNGKDLPVTAHGDFQDGKNTCVV